MVSRWISFLIYNSFLPLLSCSPISFLPLLFFSVAQFPLLLVGCSFALLFFLSWSFLCLPLFFSLPFPLFLPLFLITFCFVCFIFATPDVHFIWSVDWGSPPSSGSIWPDKPRCVPFSLPPAVVFAAPFSFHFTFIFLILSPFPSFFLPVVVVSGMAAKFWYYMAR